MLQNYFTFLIAKDKFRYNFIKESDKAKLYVGAKIKVNWYFSISKKLLAYNAELLENE